MPAKPLSFTQLSPCPNLEIAGRRFASCTIRHKPGQSFFRFLWKHEVAYFQPFQHFPILIKAGKKRCLAARAWIACCHYTKLRGKTGGNSRNWAAFFGGTAAKAVSFIVTHWRIKMILRKGFLLFIIIMAIMA
jgi:hypothetical protein